ncbi:hypothetical protein LOTGIDRAFT_239471 [Lottia gigantea]|uniref:Uncharacterized protein n=1 Tax=Lottia gigantea TaxID=225164 RepID=V3ZTY2_LOTGI|nr:hypothetical protein LOTGIDRAFT_239471 [Lottia gigantea]ESO94918.1 hypothetical protein LOTGIDRAFT_239471 [Lottia gigantea]
MAPLKLLKALISGDPKDFLQDKKKDPKDLKKHKKSNPNLPGCSIVAFAIELIHHSWDTIPVEGFKYCSSSLATDNLVRYDINLEVLGVHTAKTCADLALQGEYTQSRGVAFMSHRLAWRNTRESAPVQRRNVYKKMFHNLKVADAHVSHAQKVRKGKSSGNLPTHYSTATIGVFRGHGLYDPTDPPTHR